LRISGRQLILPAAEKIHKESGDSGITMITSLDCIPCLIRQAIETLRIASTDENVHETVMRGILKIIAEADYKQSPPLIAQWLHRHLRGETGIDDPYKEIKKEFNELATFISDSLKYEILQSPDPVYAAVKLSIAGNVIDSGATAGITGSEIRRLINESYLEVLAGDVSEFLRDVAAAKKILYIADNAGEIVFDRLLIELLGPERITLAVRGFPVINDATIADARSAGLDKIVNIIENGSDAPGTILEECSVGFLKHYNESDLIISKGQGNYETLCDVNKNIFFLLKVKCRIISDHTGFPVGTHAVIKSMKDNEFPETFNSEVKTYA